MHLTQDRLKTFATLLEDQIDQTWTVVLWRDHWNRLKKLAADSNEFKTTSSTLMGIPVIVVEDENHVQSTSEQFFKRVTLYSDGWDVFKCS